MSSHRDVTDVGVAFHSGGVTLDGSLRLPWTDGPHPAVLLLPGGSPVDRDGNPDPALSLAHVRGLELNVLRDVADALAAVGIASLRFDKRGVGRSGGDFLRRSALDLVADAEAALGVLAGRPDIGAIALFGHSEGGMLAQQVVSRGHRVVGLVSCASTANGIDSVVEHQFAGAAARAEAAGVSAVPVWSQLARLKQQIAAGEAVVSYGDDGLESGEWFRTWRALDGAVALAAVSCPVLLVQGDKDYQVPWQEALHMHRVLRAAGNPDVTLALFANVDHLLRFEPGESAPERYHEAPDRPMEPLVTRTIVDWCRRVFRGDPPPAGGLGQGFAAGDGYDLWARPDKADVAS